MDQAPGQASIGSWLALRPLSGRTHQLRVHLQHMGSPIWGDAMYAPPDVLARSPRLMLHAQRLAGNGHHQAVNRVGEGLTVTARAEDGIVEGTELTTATWIVGVQWHPEDDDGSADDRRNLFSAFVEHARAARAAR
jgi:hypothetical protein